jgi:hypothetical protein
LSLWTLLRRYDPITSSLMKAPQILMGNVAKA